MQNSLQKCASQHSLCLLMQPRGASLFCKAPQPKQTAHNHRIGFQFRLIQHNAQKLFDRKSTDCSKPCLNMISIAKFKQPDKYEFCAGNFMSFVGLWNRRAAFVALLIAEKNTLFTEQMKSNSKMLQQKINLHREKDKSWPSNLQLCLQTNKSLCIIQTMIYSFLLLITLKMCSKWLRTHVSLIDNECFIHIVCSIRLSDGSLTHELFIAQIQSCHINVMKHFAAECHINKHSVNAHFKSIDVMG